MISQENLNLNQSANLFFQEAGAVMQSLIDDASSGERDENILGLEARARRAAQVLAVARWYLGSKRITAPEDATVLDTLHEPGEWVTAGEPVVRLLAPGRLRARFFVPGDAAASLKLGDRVRVGCGGTHAASVNYVSPTTEYAPPVLHIRTDRASLVFMVEAAFDPADAAGLHPGQPASVQPVP